MTIRRSQVVLLSVLALAFTAAVASGSASKPLIKKVALTVNLPGGKQSHGSNPATLLVSAAGTGKVTKR